MPGTKKHLINVYYYNHGSYINPRGINLAGRLIDWIEIAQKCLITENIAFLRNQPPSKANS